MFTVYEHGDYHEKDLFLSMGKRGGEKVEEGTVGRSGDGKRLDFGW